MVKEHKEKIKRCAIHNKNTIWVLKNNLNEKWISSNSNLDAEK